MVPRNSAPSSLVGVRHALEGALESFTGAGAAAHNTLHHAELAHVALQQLFHPFLQNFQVFFVGFYFGGINFGFTVNFTRRAQHFFDFVDGVACDATRCRAVDALVVGACTEHGRNLDEVVLQRGVELVFVEGEFAKSVDAQAHMSGRLDGRPRGGGIGGDR